MQCKSVLVPRVALQILLVSYFIYFMVLVLFALIFCILSLFSVIFSICSVVNDSITKNTHDIESMAKAVIVIWHHGRSTDYDPDHDLCPPGETS